MSLSFKLLILFGMIFCHIVDDYYLQGILAKMKQKKWWQENAPDKLYEHDYIIALFMHAFSCSFMITLPTLLVSADYLIMCFMIFLNTCIHAVVDDLKANVHCINLVQDQVVHIIQIIATWLVIVIFT